MAGSVWDWQERRWVPKAPAAATPENPRFSLNDPAAWEAFASASASAAGLPVTRETALTYSPWWRGVNLLARDVGKVPLYVWRRAGGRRVKAPEHPAYYLLLRQPNEYQTADQFRQVLTGHAVAGGNGYAAIVRRGDGSPAELLPLNPDLTHPVRADGVLWYVSAQAGGTPRKLPAEDVFHVRGYGFDGLAGYPVYEKARDALGLGMGIQRHQSVFFRNGARVGVVLETPAKLDDKVKRTLREGWERLHAGVDNSFRTAILDNGLKASTVSLSARDSELIDTRQWSVRDVANFLGIPATKLGDPARSSYASLEQDNISYVTDALDPWLHAWECECWSKLLTEEEKRSDSHEVEFYRRALERADLAAKSGYWRTALGGRPWATANEAREDMGLDPLDDPKADELLDPLNMGQGGAANEPAPPRPARPPADDQEDAP